MIRPISIYLGGPIDRCSIDEAMGWRQELGRTVPETVLLVSPFHMFVGTVNRLTIPEADRLMRHMIYQTDATIVNLMTGSPAFGSIREIEFARAANKVCVVAQGRQGVDQSLMTHDLTIVDNLDDALTAVLEAVAKKRNEPIRPMAQFFGIQMQPPIEEDEDER